MGSKQEKTRVWIFHPESSDGSMGGLQRPYRLGKYLNEGDYEISVFSSSKFRQAKENLITDEALYLYQEGPVPFYYIRTKTYETNDHNRILNWFSYYFNLRRTVKRLILQQGKPDIVIGSSPHPLAMLAALDMGKKYKIPVINEVRDFWPEVFFLGGRVKEKSLLGKMMLAGERYIYQKSDALIFLKEGDFEYIIEKKWDLDQGGPIDLSKCNYVNNGVELDQFDQNMKDYRLDDPDLQNDAFKAVYVGSLGRINDLDRILDTAKLVKKDDVVFLIYGNGDQEDRLKQRLVDEGIDNVKFKGHVSNLYIPYILSQASVNLLNYNQNQYNWSRGNSSNKLFEYMASGKPIISTVKMGYSIIDKYNCGLELEDQSPEGLAQALQHFYRMDESDRKAIGENGRRGAKDFDYPVISAQFAQVIDKTLGGKHG